MTSEREASGGMRPEERGHDWVWTAWVRVGRKHWRRLGEKFWRVPTDIQKRRYAICRECEEFIPATTQCRRCYCAMGIKTWYAGLACPQGKWPAVTPPSDPPQT